MLQTSPMPLPRLAQAALHAAAEAGLDTGGDEHRWEGPGAPDALAADQVHDPATTLFWRNVRARVSKGGAQHAALQAGQPGIALPRHCPASLPPLPSIAPA